MSAAAQIPVEIRSIGPGDAATVVSMLLASAAHYQRYFDPFPFELEPIRRILTAARADRYWGVYVGPELAALFMLRGFDTGLAAPFFGVSVAERFARRGLLKLALSFSALWCRVNGVEQMMLKVHPDNAVAKGAYERFGFRFDRADAAGRQLVYALDLRAPDSSRTGL